MIDSWSKQSSGHVQHNKPGYELVDDDEEGPREVNDPILVHCQLPIQILAAIGEVVSILIAHDHLIEVVGLQGFAGSKVNYHILTNGQKQYLGHNFSISELNNFKWILHFVKHILNDKQIQILKEKSINILKLIIESILYPDESELFNFAWESTEVLLE